MDVAHKTFRQPPLTPPARNRGKGVQGSRGSHRLPWSCPASAPAFLAGGPLLACCACLVAPTACLPRLGSSPLCHERPAPVNSLLPPSAVFETMPRFGS